MSPAGLELAIAASERPQTHALDRADTGIGIIIIIIIIIILNLFSPVSYQVAVFW
jgi:hypothetical protein